MPENLTTEALARRDRQNAAFDRAGGQLSGFSRFARKFDGTAEERLDLDREKFDFQKSREAFDQAFQLSEQKRRAETAEARVTIATERVTLAEKQAMLNQSLAQLQQEKAALQIEDGIKATQDKMGFLRATRDLSPDDPEFEKKLSDAAELHPNSSKDDFVQKRTQWLIESRDRHVKTRAEKEAAAAAALAAKMAGLKPDTMKAGDVTFKADAPDTAARLTHLENLRMKKDIDPDVIKYLDEEITKVRGMTRTVAAEPAQPAAAPAKGITDDPTTTAAKKALREKKFYYDGDGLEPAIRRQQIREGLEVTGVLDEATKASLGINPATAPATAASEFDSPDDFKSAFASAAPGSVMVYRGKKYTKPQGAQ